MLKSGDRVKCVSRGSNVRIHIGHIYIVHKVVLNSYRESRVFVKAIDLSVVAPKIDCDYPIKFFELQVPQRKLPKWW